MTILTCKQIGIINKIKHVCLKYGLKYSPPSNKIIISSRFNAYNFPLSNNMQKIDIISLFICRLNIFLDYEIYILLC